MFLSALINFCKKLTTPIFLIFSRYFCHISIVWWRFVAILRSKQDVPNDQVNRRFPLLIKFHLIDESLECLLFLLFMYAFYLLPQNGILNIQIGFFFLYIILWYSATKIYLFLPFLSLQDSLVWSGYLEMFIKNGLLHGVFQEFSQCFIQLLIF